MAGVVAGLRGDPFVRLVRFRGGGAARLEVRQCQEDVLQ